GEPEIAQTTSHGFRGDTEEISQQLRPLNTAGPGALDPRPRHEQTGGEVVADPLCSLSAGPDPDGRIGIVDERVIKGVLELVGEAESLPHWSVLGPKFNAPDSAALVPAGRSGDRDTVAHLHVHTR